MYPFSYFIIVQRAVFGVPQRVLADILGVDQRIISLIERRKVSPTPEQEAEIRRYLHWTPYTEFGLRILNDDIPASVQKSLDAIIKMMPPMTNW